MKVTEVHERTGWVLRTQLNKENRIKQTVFNGFANMLTQGRSYRVASHLATQNRALIGANAGKDAKAFIDLVSTNARNSVIYGGGNYEDAKYYSNQFGEEIERKVERGISRPVMNPIYGIAKNYRPNESIREVEKSVACYTPSDIIYKEFGYVTYSLIKRNSLQAAGVSKLSFIPYELKLQIEKIVNDYNDRYLIRSEEDMIEEDEAVEETPITIGVTQADAIQSNDPLLAGMSVDFSEIDLHAEIDFDIQETLDKTMELPDSLSSLDLNARFEEPAVESVPSRSSATLPVSYDDDDI